MADTDDDPIPCPKCGGEYLPRTLLCPNCSPGLSANAVPDPTRTFKENDMIDHGRYQLIRKLGQGGFGEVWLAVETTGRRRAVAIKFLLADMSGRERRGRFLLERQLMIIVQHPYIAQILDLGTDNGDPFLVMDYVPPPSASSPSASHQASANNAITLCCDERQLSLKARIQLFLHVCQAVAYLHQKGIIHRDLSPANILVTDSTDPNNVEGLSARVIDFGIAKLMDVAQLEVATDDLADQYPMPKTGFVFLGKDHYASPEQLNGDSQIDTRSDIYSLGIILYELLAGLTPVTPQEIANAKRLQKLRILAETDIERPSLKVASTTATTSSTPQLRAIARQQPNVQSLSKDLTGDLDKIILKALERDIEARYASVKQFASDLESYLSGDIVPIGDLTLWYRVRKRCRKQWRALLLGALTSCALIAATIYSLDQANKATQAAGKATEATVAKDAALKIAEEEKSKAIAANAGLVRATELAQAQTTLAKANAQKAADNETDAKLKQEAAEKAQKEAEEAKIKAEKAQRETREAITRDTFQLASEKLGRFGIAELNSGEIDLSRYWENAFTPQGYFASRDGREGVALLARAAREGHAPALQRLSHLVAAWPQPPLVAHTILYTKAQRDAYLAEHPAPRSSYRDGMRWVAPTILVSTRWAETLRSLVFTGPLASTPSLVLGDYVGGGDEKLQPHAQSSTLDAGVLRRPARSPSDTDATENEGAEAQPDIPYLSAGGKLRLDLKAHDDYTPSDKAHPALTLMVRDTATQKLRRSIAVPLSGSFSHLDCAAFSPDNRWLCCAITAVNERDGNDEQTVHLWDITTGQLLFHVDPQATGTTLTHVSQGSTKPNPDIIASHLTLGCGILRSLAFSPCGQWLITASEDDRVIGLHRLAITSKERQNDYSGAVVRLLPMLISQQIWLTPPELAQSTVTHVMMSPDAQHLCALTMADDETVEVYVWQMGGPQRQPSDNTPPTALLDAPNYATSHDDHTLARLSSTNTCDVINLPTGKQVRQQKLSRKGVRYDEVQLSPSGRWLVLHSSPLANSDDNDRGNALEVWDLHRSESEGPTWTHRNAMIPTLLFSHNEEALLYRTTLRRAPPTNDGTGANSKSPTALIEATGDSLLLQTQKGEPLSQVTLLVDLRLPLASSAAIAPPPPTKRWPSDADWAFVANDSQVSVLLSAEKTNDSGSTNGSSLHPGEFLFSVPLAQTVTSPLNPQETRLLSSLLSGNEPWIAGSNHEILVQRTSLDLALWQLKGLHQLTSAIPLLPSGRASMSVDCRMTLDGPLLGIHARSENDLSPAMTPWAQARDSITGLAISDIIPAPHFGQRNLFVRDNWLGWDRERFDIAPLPIESGITQFAEALAGLSITVSPEGTRIIEPRSGAWVWEEWQRQSTGIDMLWLKEDLITRAISPRSQLSPAEWIRQQVITLLDNPTVLLHGDTATDLQLTYPFHPLTYAGLALVEQEAQHPEQASRLAAVSETALTSQRDPLIRGRIYHWLAVLAVKRNDSVATRRYATSACKELEIACNWTPAMTASPQSRFRLAMNHYYLYQAESLLNISNEQRLLRLNAALQADPDNSNILANRALDRLKLGQASQALDDARHAMMYAPQSNRAHSAEVLALLRLGKPADALSARMATGTTSDPDLSKNESDDLEHACIIACIAAAEQHGETELAATLARSIQGGQTSDQIKSYLSPEHYQLAIRLLEKAKEHKLTSDLEDRVSRASSAQLAVLLPTVEAAIKTYPDNPDFIAHRGRIAMLQGRKRAAITDFENAVSKAPSDLLMHIGAGMAMLQMAEPKKAQRILEAGAHLAHGEQELLVLNGAAAIAASARFPFADTAAAADHYRILTALRSELAGSEAQARTVIEEFEFLTNLLTVEEVKLCSDYLMKARREALKKYPNLTNQAERDQLRKSILSAPETLP